MFTSLCALTGESETFESPEAGTHVSSACSQEQEHCCGDLGTSPFTARLGNAETVLLSQEQDTAAVEPDDSKASRKGKKRVNLYFLLC
jgi:hypothetical protein